MSKTEILLLSTLVCTVKEWEVFFALNDVRNLCPLLLGGVHAGGVVCACVEDDDGLGGGRLEVRQHARDVQGVGAGVVIPVLGHRLEPRVLEDEAVVAPRGVAVVSIVQA